MVKFTIALLQYPLLNPDLHDDYNATTHMHLDEQLLPLHPSLSILDTESMTKFSHLVSQLEQYRFDRIIRRLKQSTTAILLEEVKHLESIFNQLGGNGEGVGIGIGHNVCRPY